MAGVVLVHGAWHGAWCWERVVVGLGDRGIEVLAPDLPGHGDASVPMTDLHGDASSVRGLLDGLDGPVVLVGHSYGGAVITEAGDHPSVEQLVFIAALALGPGESCVSAAAKESEAAGISWDDRPNLADGFLTTPGGMTSLEPSVAAACLYNDCDDGTIAWAIDRLGSHPLHNLQQEAHEIAWHTKPSTYVVCADDAAVHPDLQRLLATRCSETVEWPAGHSPFLSQPELVTTFLADLATGGTG
jgi:pimeloyl-ACP methyl ester carboxylesterase